VSLRLTPAAPNPAWSDGASHRSARLANPGGDAIPFSTPFNVANCMKGSIAQPMGLPENGNFSRMPFKVDAVWSDTPAIR
jgi:hypothetical protein